MSDEKAPTETPIRIVFESVDGGLIRDSKNLRLIVEAEKAIVVALADLVEQFLVSAYGGRVDSVVDDQGNNMLPPPPAQIDPLSTGDDSVEE